jgi:hypothetical protein
MSTEVRPSNPLASVWFCCGNDAKCAGGCECQCHSLTAEIERLRDSASDTNALVAQQSAMIERLRAALEGRHTLDCDMVKYPCCTRCTCEAAPPAETKAEHQT